MANCECPSGCRRTILGIDIRGLEVKIAIAPDPGTKSQLEAQLSAKEKAHADLAKLCKKLNDPAL